MTVVGLREMRQNASELVRRAQGGEQVTITVAGRPAAVLGPLGARTWRRWDDVADIFTTPAGPTTPADPDWAGDRDLVDNSLRTPWPAE